MAKETWYDKHEDIMGINIFKGEYWKSIELPNGIVIDVTKDGRIMSVEIANAKKIFPDQTRKVLQTAMA